MGKFFKYTMSVEEHLRRLRDSLMEREFFSVAVWGDCAHDMIYRKEMGDKRYMIKVFSYPHDYKTLVRIFSNDEDFTEIKCKGLDQTINTVDKALVLLNMGEFECLKLL